MNSEPHLNIYLLYEDSSGQFVEGWPILVRKMLQLIEPECQTHLVGFDLSGNDSPELRFAAKPCNWPSKKGSVRSKMVLLRRTLATQLAQDRTFVFIHFDGDCRFSDCVKRKHDNYRNYEKCLIPGIKLVLGHNGYSEEETERAMRKLIPLVSYYSIEAWLYQNSEVIDSIFSECCSKDSEKKLFDVWKKNPEMLDEILQIKERTSIKARFNQRLCEGFPAHKVFGLEKSFHASVERIKECYELCAQLQSTSCSYPEPT